MLPHDVSSGAYSNDLNFYSWNMHFVNLVLVRGRMRGRIGVVGLG